MKVKFKDGTIIEVTDTKGKSKEEMIAEAKKVYKDFKDNKKVKDSSYYIGFVSDKEKERIKEGCKKYDCKINVAGWEDGMADLYITGSVENLEQVVKNYTHKNFYKSCVSDSKKIKDKKSVKDSEVLSIKQMYNDDNCAGWIFYSGDENKCWGGKSNDMGIAESLPLDDEEDFTDTMVLERKIDLPNGMYICVGKSTNGLTIDDIPEQEVKTMSEIIEEIKKGWKIKDSKKIKDKKFIKDAFNEDQRNSMTRYLIQEGELEEGETLEDLFGSDLEDALELVYWGTQYESQGAIDVDKFKVGVIYEWCGSDIIDNITKEYVRENEYEEIYSMEEFDEIMSSYEPWDLAKTIFYSDYNPNHKYFKFRGDGNLESFDNIDDELSKYKEDALKWAINNNQNIDCDMYNLLEEYEDTIVLLTYFVINELGY